ncbi:hypothetical protein A2U01_0010999, partial [Trifolium medium]|nr:hypothetical protein [Trifolium medium]
ETEKFIAVCGTPRVFLGGGGCTVLYGVSAFFEPLDRTLGIVDF